MPISAASLGVEWKQSVSKYRQLDIQMRDFGNSVGLICALEQGGHIDFEEAYKRIKTAWKTLKAKRKGLDDGDPEA